MELDSSALVSLTSGIVAADVGTNAIAPGDIPGLTARVHGALIRTGGPEVETTDAPAKPTAAQIRRSIKADALISFEDGRPYKTLKRHLGLRGLTIADYKAKWGLPNDYPATAPSYSAARSALAKAAGLGQPRKASALGAKSTAASRAADAASARRGRPKNAPAPQP
jgi:predicted transcriptional regulator